MLFYVAIIGVVFAAWAGMVWAVRNEHERRKAERQMEEFRVNLEKLQLALGEALLPAFAKMAEAFAAAGAAARRASEQIRAAAQERERKEGKR